MSNCTTAYMNLSIECLSRLDGQLHRGLHEYKIVNRLEEQLHHGRHESMSIRTYSASARA